MIQLKTVILLFSMLQFSIISRSSNHLPNQNQLSINPRTINQPEILERIRLVTNPYDFMAGQNEAYQRLLKENQTLRQENHKLNFHINGLNTQSRQLTDTNRSLYADYCRLQNENRNQPPSEKTFQIQGTQILQLTKESQRLKNEIANLSNLNRHTSSELEKARRALQDTRAELQKSQSDLTEANRKLNMVLALVEAHKK